MLFFKSSYSILKSTIKLEDALKKCAELGIKSAALCDDRLFGVVKFYNLAKKYNITPVIGAELKVETDVYYVFAENHTGYQNLCRLNSLEYISEKTFDKHSEGLRVFNENLKENICCVVDEEDAYLLDILDCLRDNRRYNGEITYKNIHIRKEKDLDIDLPAFEFRSGGYHLPKFQTENSVGYLKKLCKNGLLKRYGDKPHMAYIERMMYELSIIEKMGFADYFLIVWDYVSYARKEGIAVGIGRGSGAGSICAYCLGITGIDPMRYGLIFERFLNPERISMPDFDIDFCIHGRQKVIDYILNKYPYSAQIIAPSTMSAKTLTRDLAKIGLNIFQSEKVIEKLDSLPRHISMHAAGIVISDRHMNDYIPTIKHFDTVLTQFDMIDLEQTGLVKMDILGLRNLTIIDRCAKEVGYDINNVPLDDKETFALLQRGDSKGIFQLESDGITRLTMQVHPAAFEDLTAIVSLYRPGPADSIPTYIRNRKNPNLIRYDHHLLRTILKETYGCVVYQEQVIEIFRTLAGYSYGQADLLRRAMSKRKKDIMRKERERFIQGAVYNGITTENAESLFEKLEKFSSYAFNKSHAVCYAYIAYQTAFLKAHYREKFMELCDKI